MRIFLRFISSVFFPDRPRLSDVVEGLGSLSLLVCGGASISLVGHFGGVVLDSYFALDVAPLVIKP